MAACDTERQAVDDALDQEAAAWGILCVKYLEVSAAWDVWYAASQARQSAEDALYECEMGNSGGSSGG